MQSPPPAAVAAIRTGLAAALHSPKSNRTAPMRETNLGPPLTLRASDEEGLLRAAFRDAHGARLHGFALLVTLGDENLASALAADALAAGTRHAAALRHPERAAAWMRRRILRGTPSSSRRGSPAEQERRTALAALGVDAATYDVLAGFSVQQRAALVAGLVEGFSPLDLELVLGSNASSVRRRVSETRRSFMARRAAAADRTLAPDASSLEGRIQRIADQALGRSAR
jgi:DNA-directed RNA polymerase specialized sigma24 family protein